jgi:2-keto-4-pentenoate hydratase/2-oxohepta-3-ene-1,7-dioic acid hydratase in catechol pathway
MRLVTFSDAQGQRIGIHDAASNEVIDLSTASSVYADVDMLDVIRAGAEYLAALQESANRGRRIDLAHIQIDAPIPRPVRNVLCVGKNYKAHATEFASSGFDASAGNGSAIPEVPVVFSKMAGSVIGPGKPIPASLDPENSVDYEGELAVIIGRAGRGIAKRDAMDHIFGYTILNDVTARNLQQRHKQWLLGKSLDGFCPMGPAIVTADEIDDIERLKLRTYVNGERRQSAKIADLIFGIPELIETISRGITLEPGDVIATGTPAGVGIGFDPPKFLKAGDEVTIEIDAIGKLQNPVE